MLNFFRFCIFSIFALFIMVIIDTNYYYYWDFKNGLMRGSFAAKPSTSEDLLGEKDHFSWYRKEKDNFLKLNKNYKSAISPDIKIVLFKAYEFHSQYSISHLTPEVIGADVFCRYFNRQNVELGRSAASFIFPGSTISCPRRNGTAFISVSITPDGRYDKPIPFIDRKPTVSQPKYDLSLCLSPIYGTEPKWLMLIETIEHYKLQGVTHFYIYAFEVNEYDSKTIASYIETGEVELIPMVDRFNRTGVHMQHGMYQDCTLRSRGVSKWSIFADLDERLIMTELGGTILEYLEKRSQEDSKISGFVFRQQWVLKTESMPEKYQGDEQILDWMPSHRWHNSTPVGSKFHTAKCIINPRKVFWMWTHYPKLVLPGTRVYQLTPEEGVVRHYRDAHIDIWSTKYFPRILGNGTMLITNYTDTKNEQLLEQLTRNVQERAKLIYGSEL